MNRPTDYDRLADRYGNAGMIALMLTLIVVLYDRLPLIRLIDWIF